MPVLDMFRRGWGWVWLLGATELVLIGAQLMPLLDPAPPRTRIPQTTTQPDSPARISLQPILDFHPFGTPDIPPSQAITPDEPAPPVPEAPPPPAPVTEGYVLQGVLFRDDGVPSRAILAWNGGAAASFVAGDTLPSGATLAGVEANRVWLEKDGEQQFLAFPITQSDPETAPPDAETAPPDETGSDLPALTDTTRPPAQTATMPQPDLRNLIPGLVATPPPGN